MKELRSFLSSGLLFAYVVKILLSGGTLSDIGVIAVLASLLGLQFYTEHNKSYSELETETGKKLSDMVQTINQQNEVIKKMALEVDSVRNNVSSLKLVSGAKKMG